MVLNGQSRMNSAGNTPLLRLRQELDAVLSGSRSVAATTRHIASRIETIQARLERFEKKLDAIEGRLSYLEAIRGNSPMRVTYRDTNGHQVADPLADWDGLSSIRITN
jgi:hypothetical protein